MPSYLDRVGMYRDFNRQFFRMPPSELAALLIGELRKVRGRQTRGRLAPAGVSAARAGPRGSTRLLKCDVVRRDVPMSGITSRIDVLSVAMSTIRCCPRQRSPASIPRRSSQRRPCRAVTQVSESPRPSRVPGWRRPVLRRADRRLRPRAHPIRLARDHAGLRDHGRARHGLLACSRRPWRARPWLLGLLAPLAGRRRRSLPATVAAIAPALVAAAGVLSLWVFRTVAPAPRSAAAVLAGAGIAVFVAAMVASDAAPARRRPAHAVRPASASASPRALPASCRRRSALSSRALRSRRPAARCCWSRSCLRGRSRPDSPARCRSALIAALIRRGNAACWRCFPGTRCRCCCSSRSPSSLPTPRTRAAVRACRRARRAMRLLPPPFPSRPRGTPRALPVLTHLQETRMSEALVVLILAAVPRRRRRGGRDAIRSTRCTRPSRLRSTISASSMIHGRFSKYSGKFSHRSRGEDRGRSSWSSRPRRSTPTTTTRATGRVRATSTCARPISSTSPSFRG